MTIMSLLIRAQKHSNERITQWGQSRAAIAWAIITPDSKIHGADLGPTWVLSAPDGPHVGPMSLAIRDGAPLTQLSLGHKSNLRVPDLQVIGDITEIYGTGVVVPFVANRSTRYISNANSVK